MDITKPCPACNGELAHDAYVQSGAEDGELVEEEIDCRCTETDTPGQIVIGTIDLSDITDTLADILDKVVDIKEKVDES